MGQKLMNLRAGIILGLLAILFLVSRSTPVAANFCKISNVSYDYPHQAEPAQHIEVHTTIDGSCYTGQERYYTARVDLVDPVAGNTFTWSGAPIGADAENFSVTVTSSTVTPSITNASWTFEIRVYVIQNGGGGGPYLLDYSTSTSATIQIVSTTAVPELAPVAVYASLTVVFALATVLLTANNSNPNLKRRHTTR